MATGTEATRILLAMNDGDRSQAGRLMELVYGELRGLARGYMARRGRLEPMQPTELVHEAFLKLVRTRDADWRGRSHFYAVAATAMRQILVDEARKRLRTKRGGGDVFVSLRDEEVLSLERPEDVLAVDQALDALAERYPLQAQLVELRFFGGMTMAEIADALDTPLRTLHREWSVARAWLRRGLA